MREVIPKLVWIGNGRDVRDVRSFVASDISAVVDLTMEEPAGHFPREVIYCRFPLLDGTGNPPRLLLMAIRTVASLIETNTATLVACGAGMSRSPAIVAAALAMTQGDSADEWLKKIAAQGPHDVSPALWNEIRQLVESKCVV